MKSDHIKDIERLTLKFEDETVNLKSRIEEESTLIKHKLEQEEVSRHELEGALRSLKASLDGKTQLIHNTQAENSKLCQDVAKLQIELDSLAEEYTSQFEEVTTQECEKACC